MGTDGSTRSSDWRKRILGLVVMAVLLYPPAASSAVRGPVAWSTGLGASRVRLAAGANHTCQVNGDGTVRCWGKNNLGQLGNGTTVDSTTPVTVSGVSDTVAVAAGGNHSCALIVGGIVLCWGANSSGQLGNGTQTNSTTPVTVSGLINVVAITAGPDYTCALLATGVVRCWGQNFFGELGDGTTTNRTTPVPVFGVSNVVAITAGGSSGQLVFGDHTCALLASGSVSCWGANTDGQLGDGTTTNRPTPVAVFGIRDAVGIAAGEIHTCAVLADGSVSCWGDNSAGELGDGTTTSRSIPVNVSGLSDGVAITASPDHTCSLLADQTAQCWGANASGQLGNGTTSNSPSPVSVLGLGSAVGIAAGTDYTCAVLADESARCWGFNQSEELGNGTTSPSATPTAVGGGGGSVSPVAVTAGLSHTCALRANGAVSCWGFNPSGQLGDATTSNSSVPTLVSRLADVAEVAAGGSDTCAVGAGGVVSCWGDNGDGQLGDGTTTSRSLPGAVLTTAGLLSPKIELRAIDVTVGQGYACALQARATVACWGDNAYGQLGDGTTTNRVFPVIVSGLTGAVAVSVGLDHTCALIDDGTVRCWGENDDGQVGDGTTTNRLTPVPVVGISNAIAIAAGNAFVSGNGEDHTCVLLADGTGRCWGYNLSGALGDGTRNNATVPDTVIGMSNAGGLAAGGQDTCTVVAAANVFCWGHNAVGQLGDNTITDRLTPTLVLVRTPFLNTSFLADLGDVAQLAAGFNHTCAVIADGSLSCWGNNFEGQLGLGTNGNDELTATEVPSFTLNIDPTVALARDRRSAVVDVIATCKKGRRLRVTVELIQRRGSATSTGNFLCAGRLVSYPVTLRARRRRRFSPGAGRVIAHAIIRQRRFVVDRRKWTRAVKLVVARHRG
jgi:alpha-tubulin suppressor-like RCC1 family protein